MIPILFMLVQAAAAPVPAAPAAPPPGPWEPRAKETGGVLSTSASVVGKDGSSRLVVKCDDGENTVVSVQFFARQPLQIAGDDGRFPDKAVTLRFDGGAANVYDWQMRSNAAFVSNTAAVTSLTLQLAKAKQIKVETTSASNFRFEAVFDGPASDAPIRTVLQACKYVLGQGPAPVPAAEPKK